MTTQPLSRPEYVRRVSFTNLYQPPRPTQILLEYGVDVPITPILPSLSSVPRSCSSSRQVRSILKNAACDPNVRLDLLDTSLLAPEQILIPSPLSPPLQKPAARTRYHSTDGVTDEELLAMDPQFQSTSSKHDLTKFRFDFAGRPGYCAPAPLKAPATLVKPRRRLSMSPYASSNENNYRLVSFLAQHQDYSNMFGRTILITISGRRHSWNALDWILDGPNSILRDGDYLVVASLVLRQVWQKKGPKAATALIHKKGEAILNYIMHHKGLEAAQCKVKLSVEIAVEPEPPVVGLPFVTSPQEKKPAAGGKYLLRQLFSQYLPSILVLGTKLLSLNFRYTRTIKNSPRDLFLLKFSLYAAKYLPVPVVFVGSQTKYGRPRQPPRQPPVISFQPFLDNANYRNSVALISSSESDSSSRDTPCGDIQKEIDACLDSTSSLRFSDMLALVTDKLRAESMELVALRTRLRDSVSFDDGNLFRNRLQMTNDGIYRVRSLLPSPDLKDTTFSKKGKRLLSMSSTGAVSARSVSLEPATQKADSKRKRSIWRALGFKK